VCDDAQSDVSAPLAFVTSAGLPFAENFDASTSQPGGWKKYEGAIGDWETTTYGWSISASAGGVSSNHEYSEIYGYEGFYDYWGDYYDDYIAQYTLTTPEIILNATDGNGVELSFDMSLTNSTTSSTAPDPANCLGREFSVVISTDGGASWTNLASWSNNGDMGLYSSIPNSQTKYSLDLTAYAGQSVMIGFYHNFGTATLGYYDEYYDVIDGVEPTYIHLDNIVMKEVNPSCMGVNNLKVSNVSFVGAQVDWGYKGGSTDAVIALSKTNVLSLENAIVVDTILNDSTYLLPALDASSTYYVFVEQLCDEGETSAWEMTSFATAIGVRFAPIFTSTTRPADWNLYKGYAADVFADPSALTPYTSGWSIVAADTAIDTYHLRSEIYSTWNYWITTPVIDLTPNVGEGLLLSFDLALTAFSSYYVDQMYTGDDDKFMVVISEDGGATWTEANATIWANDGTGDYVLNDVPGHATRYTIDMSRYAGKTIQIAFHQESSESNTDNYIHVGNIVLDRIEAINYLGDVCDGEDYDGSVEGNPFYISSDEYQPGLNIYSQYHPADPSVDGSKDTMLVLNLMVNMPAFYEYAVDVCEGEHYVDANFDINITLNTRTQQRNTRWKTEAGCDSIIVMNLTIHPIQHVDIFGLTCQGTPYHFGGKDIYQAGTYADTASSVITGCDSISVLHLSYDQPSEDWRDKILCNGDSYTMADGTIISAPGQYVENATKVSGCDSLIHWNIMVADEFGVAHDTVDVTELPYFFNNQQVLASDATIGSHDVTVPMSCGDGILRILVEQKTGLNEIMDKRRDVQKLIMDERLIIIRNGKSYDALGGHVKSHLR
ncbi:MAG: choice-of-anchor J domain-containing protein, partial [Paludibacteraceae bacterium]|nr:choice-of-anchor J domain-containing protein [Paludibacteraceae bacterium]